MPGWSIREPSEELEKSYRTLGYWDDTTFAELAYIGIDRYANTPLTVHSKLRPYRGTIGRAGDEGLRLANALKSHGVGPGDVVAFQLPNWSEAIATYYGLLALGVVLIPIVHIYGHKEVAHILRESGARVLITADRFGRQDYLANLEEIGAELTDLELVVVVGEEGRVPTSPNRFLPWKKLVQGSNRLPRPADVESKLPVIVGYTSGTTSEAKGVIHSHRSFLAEMQTLGRFGAQDRSVICQPAPVASITASPVSHVTGIIAAMRPLLGGGPMHLMDVWDASQVLSLMESSSLGISGGATFFLTSLLDDPSFRPELHVPMMRRISLGGSPIPIEVVRRATDLGISITRAYGSTEHPSTTMSLHSDPEAKRCYTDGRLLPGSEVKIVDDDGHQVSPGSAGEILSRGPELFVGYVDARLSEQAFDQGGWYRTGDIGTLDEEGYLTITDRKKDIIIRGGENISAQEVEEILQRLPGVAEVAVVAAPDSRYGEHGCAMIRIQPGHEQFSLDEMRSGLERAGLARQKWPEELQFVNEFPRTASGKIQKNVLRLNLRNQD